MNTKLEKYKGFLSTLKSEIDLPYFANEVHTSFDELRQAIEDGNGFDVEIIYYSRAIQYLKENDPSLRESLQLAADMGFDVKSLNSEILASLLASDAARQEFEELETEIQEFLDELNEEEEEEEEE